MCSKVSDAGFRGGNRARGMFLMSAILMVSCVSKEAWFYTEIETWGDRRIPLIYPTYAATTEGVEGPWFFLQSYSIEGHGRVTHLDILDSIVVGYDEKDWIQVIERRDTLWYMIIPSMMKAYQFNNETEFLQTLSTVSKRTPIFRKTSDIWLELLDGKDHWECFPFALREDH